MNLSSPSATIGLMAIASATKPGVTWREKIGNSSSQVPLTSAIVGYECKGTLATSADTFTLQTYEGIGVATGEGSSAEGADGLDFEGTALSNSIYPIYGMFIKCKAGSFTVVQTGVFDGIAISAGGSAQFQMPLGCGAGSNQMVLTATSDATEFEITILGGID